MEICNAQLAQKWNCNAQLAQNGMKGLPTQGFGEDISANCSELVGLIPRA
jgi:hypothetical protein